MIGRMASVQPTACWARLGLDDDRRDFSNPRHHVRHVGQFPPRRTGETGLRNSFNFARAASFLAELGSAEASPRRRIRPCRMRRFAVTSQSPARRVIRRGPRAAASPLPNPAIHTLNPTASFLSVPMKSLKVAVGVFFLGTFSVTLAVEYYYTRNRPETAQFEQGLIIPAQVYYLRVPVS